MQNTFLEIPKIGLGSNLKLYAGETKLDIANSFKYGLQIGYKFFDLDEPNSDTDNDIIIDVLSNYNRSELFISQKTYTLPSVEYLNKQINKLQYLDLFYLGNPPITTSRQTYVIAITEYWKAMINIKENGLCKSIGICNFHFKQLEILLEICDDLELEYPEYALLEIHPINTEDELVQLYKKYDIKIISYSSLGGDGSNFYTDNPQILSVNKNFNHVVLNDTISKDISVLVKSINYDHIKSNFEVLKYNKELNSNNLDLNIYCPLNNDTANAKMANNQLK